jgi:predicted small lipoprotein YifL
MRILACILSVTLFITSCGKKGPLIYPDMLAPAAPSDAAARQIGDRIRLIFSVPTRDRSGRPCADVAGVKISRRESPAGQGAECSACTSDFRLFKQWYADTPGESQRIGNRVMLRDGGVRSGGSYTYTFVAFTKDGIDGATSGPVTAEIVLPPQPPVIRAVSHPTEVDLEFAGIPVDGTFVGYSLYRAIKSEPFSYMPYITSPLVVNRYTDMGLDRGTTYVYAARTVVRLSTGALVESELSNEVEAQLKDDE